MPRKSVYYESRSYRDYLNMLIRKKLDFKVVSTAYTKSIKTGFKNIIFNEKGVNDFKLLSLIQKVRKDGDLYLENIEDKNLGYIHFFDLFEKPISDQIIHKVDIKSAYWEYAVQNGIVSQKTNEYFMSNFPTKELDGSIITSAKEARLKALGSLATTKIVTEYKNGVPLDNFCKPETRKTKKVYMEICKGVDDLMRDCVRNVEGCIYYYWDCIFISSQFSKQAVEFFKDNGYGTSIKETKLDIVKLGELFWLVSKNDNKQYMVRAENSHLLEEAWKESKNKFYSL